MYLFALWETPPCTQLWQRYTDKRQQRRSRIQEVSTYHGGNHQTSNDTHSFGLHGYVCSAGFRPKGMLFPGRCPPQESQSSDFSQPSAELLKKPTTAGSFLWHAKWSNLLSRGTVCRELPRVDSNVSDANRPGCPGRRRRGIVEWMDCCVRPMRLSSAGSVRKRDYQKGSRPKNLCGNLSHVSGLHLPFLQGLGQAMTDENIYTFRLQQGKMMREYIEMNHLSEYHTGRK